MCNNLTIVDPLELNLREKVQGFIDQAQMGGFSCIAGPLENNVPYREMRDALEKCIKRKAPRNF